jgi:2-iminobutanoate/2-iminopropanoate deaminase
VGDTLYIAGHIGLDPKTAPAPADPEQEARRMMDGIKTTVAAAGLSMGHVVSVEIFCTDLKLYETFNAVYKTYFQAHDPARAFVGTDKLLRGGRYGVMGIAISKQNEGFVFCSPSRPVLCYFYKSCEKPSITCENAIPSWRPSFSESGRSAWNTLPLSFRAWPRRLSTNS